MQSYLCELILRGLTSRVFAQKANLSHMTISRIRQAYLSHHYDKKVHRFFRHE